MRPALISPVSVEIEFDADSFARNAWRGYEPPLGILTLASILRLAGTEPLVFDLDAFFRQALVAKQSTAEAFQAAASAISSLDTDLFGFGTMCNSYPLTLRLAAAVHQRRLDARIVLGGPQASAVDVGTLRQFDFIDAVIRGEVDQIAVRALEQVMAGPVDVPGVTHRAGGEIVRNPDPPVVLDLDAVPPPAFDLCPHIQHCSRLPIELGRGCPFACSFCSTNDFFRRRFRLRSPQCVLREMRRLEALYGATDFDLVHDMFTVDRKRVVEFCRYLQSSGVRYSWHCSARTDFVDRELIETMRAAGCGSVFFGVETGSARLQKIIGKDLGIDEAARAVELIEQAGMDSTVSLIVGFPEEQIEDLNATASFAINSARFDSATVQVALLTPLAGTPLYKKWRDQLCFDGIIPEQSLYTWNLEAADLALIEQHPDLFSNFYGVPAGTGRQYVGEFRWFLRYAASHSRWLAVALNRDWQGFTDVFDAWLDWKGAKRRSERYYATSEFVQDLCRFVTDRLAPESSCTQAACLMARYYAAMYRILDQPLLGEPFAESSAPRIAPTITLIDFPFRPGPVIDALRREQTLGQDCFQAATVAFRREADRIVDAREISPLTAAILRSCDGRTSTAEIAKQVGKFCPELPGIGPEEFLEAGLQFLGTQGLVGKRLQATGN
jgi:radical SAM superfamily enzyme YgiQ (UPF0313 family)